MLRIFCYSISARSATSNFSKARFSMRDTYRRAYGKSLILQLHSKSQSQ